MAYRQLCILAFAVLGWVASGCSGETTSLPPAPGDTSAVPGNGDAPPLNGEAPPQNGEAPPSTGGDPPPGDDGAAPGNGGQVVALCQQLCARLSACEGDTGDLCQSNCDLSSELLAALLHRPSILFLDEPTLGLDINAQESIRSFLKRYNQRYGATVLLTSHYMADITALCSRVLVIHQGKLVYDGALSSLSERLTPNRVVELRLTDAVSDEVLRSFGELQAKDGLRVTLLVERALLRKTIARIFEELKPSDLNVHEPAIETVLGPLLRGEQLVEGPESLAATQAASDVGHPSDVRTS